MIVAYNNITYRTKYYPFFRIRRGKDFDVYSITYPSGNLEEFLVFDTDDPKPALEDYLTFCIKEYLLEDNDMLTNRALCIKNDLSDLLEIVE